MSAAPGIQALLIEALMRRRRGSIGHPNDAGYQQWLQKHGLREDPTYDLHGAYAAGMQPDDRGHLGDEFKMPGHPTFSTDSRYSGQGGAVGGEWIEASPGSWVFNASPWNLRNTTKQQLMDYFDRVEPGVTVNFPDGTSYVGGSR